MSKIQELKDELKREEELEKLKRLQDELDSITKEYKGKCFGSHTFERNCSALAMGATYYENFFIRDNAIYVLERTISVSKYNNLYRPSKTDITYMRHHYERCLTDNKHNASYNLYSGYSFYRKEISLEKFEQLWMGTEECSEIIKSLFTTELPKLKTELIRGGDSSNEDEIVRGIAELGLDVIDFKAYPKVHNVIEYATLPMYQNRRWLPRIFAKQILEYHIINLKKRAADSFTPHRISSAIDHEISIIEDFINTELKC